jgi:hypothetical protein
MKPRTAGRSATMSAGRRWLVVLVVVLVSGGGLYLALRPRAVSGDGVSVRIRENRVPKEDSTDAPDKQAAPRGTDESPTIRRVQPSAWPGATVPTEDIRPEDRAAVDALLR